MSFGQPLTGCDEGPSLLRKAGLRNRLAALNWRVEDQGDVKFPAPKFSDPVADVKVVGGHCKQSYSVGNGCKELYIRTKAASEAGKFVLSLGGDHSIGVGSVSGILAARPDTGVIWVDAHADLNSPATSPSGNMHGMPVAFLMGLCPNKHIPGMEWLDACPKLSKEKIVYIGLRDIDAGERALLKEMGICAFTMQHVDKYGIGKIMEMTLDRLCKDGKTPLHCSYDIDAVDPMIAPASGTLVRGGLTYREANYLAEAVYETGMLGSLDMVEVNPSLSDSDGANMTVEAANTFIESAMGSRIL
jgi:arginase